MTTRGKSKNRYWLGKKFSKEHREKLSIAKKGKKIGGWIIMTEELRKKFSDAKKGCIPWNKGILMDDNCKKKVSRSVKEYYKNPKARKRLSDAIKKKWQDMAYRKKCEDAQKGDKARLWEGGISFEPYSQEWTKILKDIIRQRDNYKCHLCGNKKKGSQSLPVHHIDYDKKNCNPDNLITLCPTCHGKTNQNRQYWINYFRQPQRLNESTSLQKG